MLDNKQWNLFGLDLTLLVVRCRLGISQLMLDTRSRLHQACFPAVTFYKPDAEPRVHSPDVPAFLPEAFAVAVLQQRAIAAVIPEYSVLCREIELPCEAEVDLPQMAAFEAAAHSPFPPEATVHGWQVLSRAEGALRVVIAITSAEAVDAARAHAVECAAQTEDKVEVWAETHRGDVMLHGFGESVRRQQYFRALGFLAGRVGLLVAVIFALAFVPLLSLSITNAQLDEQLQITQERASRVTSVRDELVDLEARVAVAESFFQDRPLYNEWLNYLALVTPDSVFFQRLQLKANQLTVTGLAENAADYQTVLASSESFSQLEAPTAFTRDTQRNRERFVLVMQLTGPEDI